VPVPPPVPVPVPVPVPDPRPRRLASGIAAALALLTAAAPAFAQPEEIPRGQFGMAAVLRRNVGAMEERYGLGYLWGFVAGYQVTRPDEPLGAGLVLTTLFGRSQLFGVWGDDDPTIATGPLKYLEMALGLRVRYRLGEALPLYVAGSVGGALLRTDVPVPPDDERLHLGGFVGLGADFYLWDSVLLGLDARFGLLGGGPRGITFMFTAALGR
jgi:hypothetical protein